MRRGRAVDCPIQPLGRCADHRVRQIGCGFVPIDRLDGAAFVFVRAGFHPDRYGSAAAVPRAVDTQRRPGPAAAPPPHRHLRRA